MASSFSAQCLLILFCISCQSAESSLNFQRNNGSEVGPFCSRKCTMLDDSADEDTYTPLYQCSCSLSCSVYEDCCFDSPFKNNSVRRSRHFVCLSVVGHDRYRAVSGCPSNVTADFCKDGLGHLPPVTSRVTNITYTNIFCAKCNDDKEDLITWNVELRCSSDLHGSAKYMYRSGNIWSLDEATGSKAICKYYVHFNDSSFMQGLELRSCTGYVRKRSRCSSSWKDTSILEMCRSYEDPVYFHNTAFRNAHCGLCNYLNPELADCVPDHVKSILASGVVDARVRKFCKTRDFDACIDMLKKGRPYAFAELLNINEEGCVPPRGRRCCIGEAFDFRSQRCRKIRN